MTARAHVEYDWQIEGLRIAIRRQSTDGSILLRWTQPNLQYVPAGQSGSESIAADGSPYLTLQTEEARALYEALADHFGNATNDVRLLRRDYEAERARVDKFIDHHLARRTR